MGDMLRSNWSITVLLTALHEFRRSDDGVDLLAFRLEGAIPGHSAYIYLYGDDPNLIHFDLEDAATTDQWDHAVRRGDVRSIEELQGVIRGWLQRG
jgi:hypothetical protein